MRIDGISRIDAVDPLATARQREALPKEGLPAGTSSSGGKEAVELATASKPSPTGIGSLERYAKIRFDDDSKTVVIQIVDATSGDVIREIPPEAWVKLKESIPLPKGTLIEKEQ